VHHSKSSTTHLVRDVAGQPVKPFIQTLSRSRASALNVPATPSKHKPSASSSSQSPRSPMAWHDPRTSSQNPTADYQWRCRSECRPSLSVISAAFIAFGRSCLLANTSRTASRSSSCTSTTKTTQSQNHSDRSQKLSSIAQKTPEVPRSASDAARLWLPQHGLYRCYPPQRSVPACSGSNASTMAESAARIFTIVISYAYPLI
jgi:hypothetical protein